MSPLLQDTPCYFFSHIIPKRSSGGQGVGGVTVGIEPCYAAFHDDT